MISSILLAAAETVPATPAWNPTVGIIISISSLVIVLLSTRIEKPLVGPKFPILPISIPTFVAAMAFGHIIGVGIVLGLTNIGRL
ncbi:MAG: photosystem I reaction center subunit PsaK [Nostoc sp. DedQUE08]|uniref:photosystem I reaction center subunit PsaK n=1 Tax=unclassified Nostoc TaxID=2593658 RepID=UPI002AD412BA|nr:MULTISPECIES: photosystem I reaction center subunit PsaK [unclassified Nostoc]MDZ8032548.1 photosystem I reaction center subunit PsaK [Nostoc sp. DedSLP04]MDZ8070486.1 photosystem I reaction center subunit PsaK [Nostoc sp. DedQUE08]MDZ8093255.1 photosystem I reaction center subunit PsaK [Nostoc sp. DedQUE05]MDZ8130404.1 photosystem I reaction center subunit PsaK [Nostoc sp. DedQUE07]MDZ8134069.1 photosystem I reaction center subunit PsaK [Nostoc sp. DedQUE04]